MFLEHTSVSQRGSWRQLRHGPWAVVGRGEEAPHNPLRGVFSSQAAAARCVPGDHGCERAESHLLGTPAGYVGSCPNPDNNSR